MDQNTSNIFQERQDSTKDTGQFLVGFAVTGLVCLFGLIVNVCVYLTVLQIKVLCRYMWYLLSLTFFDWMICFTALFHLVLPAYCFYFQPISLIQLINSQPFFRIADAYAFSTLHCAEIWITVALTHDRFWLICQPLESGSLFDKRRTKKTICVVSVLAFLYNIPKVVYMSYYHSGQSQGCQNNSVPFYPEINTSEELLWESSDITCLNTTQCSTMVWVYCKIYNVILNWLFLHILPTLCLCIYNIKLFLKVRTAKRHLCRVSTLKKEKDSFWATVNIIALVIFFIICQTPSFIFKVCAFFNVATHNGMAFQVTQLILIINSAANFVVYFLIFGLFRQLAMSFFCGCKIEKEQTDQVSKTCSSNTFARRHRPVQVKYTNQLSKNGSIYKTSPKVTHV